MIDVGYFLVEGSWDLFRCRGKFPLFHPRLLLCWHRQPLMPLKQLGQIVSCHQRARVAVEDYGNLLRYICTAQLKG